MLRLSVPLQEDATPVPAAALGKYELVFDAVYTPLHTRLLREAQVRRAGWQARLDCPVAILHGDGWVLMQRYSLHAHSRRAANAVPLFGNPASAAWGGRGASVVIDIQCELSGRARGKVRFASTTHPSHSLLPCSLRAQGCGEQVHARLGRNLSIPPCPPAHARIGSHLSTPSC